MHELLLEWINDIKATEQYRKLPWYKRLITKNPQHWPDFIHRKIKEDYPKLTV